MSYNKKFWFSFIPFAALGLFGLFNVLTNFSANQLKKEVNKTRCSREKLIKNCQIEGIIIEKFTDKKEVSRIKYINGNKILNADDIYLNDSFFNTLQIGDSIKKEKGSLELLLLNAERKISYHIDFNCNEDLLKK